MSVPCLAFLLALVPTAGAAELLWPLEQAEGQRALSSSFCEDRGSHLHGGVDMSTGGRVGVPVLCSLQGEDLSRFLVEHGDREQIASSAKAKSAYLGETFRL